MPRSRDEQATYWKNRRSDGKVIQHKSIPQPQKFIAVDGEGIETATGQVYALLSSSLGNHVSRVEGLSTEECLRFLLDLKQDRTQLVGFGFSYDVNMILKDIKPEELLSLYEEDVCWFRGQSRDYKIRRIKGKSFSISEYSHRRYYHEQSEKLRSITVWDTFGFFQGSFLRTVSDWKLSITNEEQSILTSGKSERGGFVWEELESLKRYNLLECTLLVSLMEKVQSTLRELDLYLSRWDGAGAVAACMMKKYHVGDHIIQEYPSDLQDAQMRAYFGGRTQCVRFGVFHTPTYHYDINSAYPSSYLDLPSCIGEWSITQQYIPTAKYGLYQLTWNIPRKNNPITPFPYRLDTGSITYPHQGRGIYHAQLVSIALPKWQRYITIERGWIFTPSTDEKPFSFVQEFMTERLRLKSIGDLRHIMMKLGANSIYGKTAQGVSYKEQIPPYQNYFWAGMITSWSHCRLLEAALKAPEEIIFFGTDAIFSSVPLDLSLGKELGTWEDCGIIDRFELYQPGLYRMIFTDEEPQTKTRGFHKEEIDFDELRRVWESQRYTGMYNATVTRFRGYEISMAQNNPDEWRTWKRDIKRVRLSPGGFGTVEDPGRLKYDDLGVYPNYRFQYINGGDELSARYQKKDLILPVTNDAIMMAEFEWEDNNTID